MKTVMNLASLPLIFLSFLSSGQIQQTQYSGHDFFEPGGFVQQILKAQQTPATANKGTSAIDRLIGHSHYSGSSTLIDSAHYKYNTFSQRSNLDNNFFSTYTEARYDGPTTLYPTYNILYSAERPALAFDTGYLIDHSTMTLPSEVFISRAYHGGNIVNQFIRVRSGTNTLNYNYTYGHDMQDRLTSITGVPFRLDYPDTYALLRFYSGNRIVRDSVISTDLVNGKPYSYTDYVYDTNDTLTEAKIYTWNNIGAGMYGLYERDTFTYLSNKLFTSVRSRPTHNETDVDTLLY